MERPTGLELLLEKVARVAALGVAAMAETPPSLERAAPSVAMEGMWYDLS
jgi:hypothetical protein